MNWRKSWTISHSRSFDPASVIRALASWHIFLLQFAQRVDGLSIVYEWDERKSRRGYMLKMLGAIGVAVAVASVPAWFVELVFILDVEPPVSSRDRVHPSTPAAKDLRTSSGSPNQFGLINGAEVGSSLRSLTSPRLRGCITTFTKVMPGIGSGLPSEALSRAGL